MRYQGRELRSLWEVELYDGNPDAKNPKTTTVTVVAFNQVEAIRLCGSRKVASLPKFLHHVTWPENEGGPIYKINGTAGPDKEKIRPDIQQEE